MEARSLRNAPAYTLDRETAPAMWLAATLWLFHATGTQTDDRCSFMEQVMSQGLGPPAHRHPLAIEGFYVLEGSMSFHVDGTTVSVGAGSLVHLPRLIEHTFTVNTPETRVLNFYAPAGLELQIMSLARPAEERRLPTREEGPPPKSPALNIILSQLYGTVAVTALPFNAPPSKENMATSAGWHPGSLRVATIEDGPHLDAFGLHWRLLAGGADTDNTYDLCDVIVPAGATMPTRVIGTDEALYVVTGGLVVECDGDATPAGVGSFTYAKAGSVLGWRAGADEARALVFHFPGGFDRALVGARGKDALVAAGAEATGTRFLDVFPLPPEDVPPASGEVPVQA